MPRRTLRDWIRSLERAPAQEMWAALAFIGGRRVELDADERNAAIRRAELLLAAGGDPHRRLDPFGRAATAVASDLDRPAARAALADGLRALEPEIAGLRGAGEAIQSLLADEELAWQCYAAALLAEALAGEDGDSSGSGA